MSVTSQATVFSPEYHDIDAIVAFVTLTARQTARPSTAPVSLFWCLAGGRTNERRAVGEYFALARDNTCKIEGGVGDRVTATAFTVFIHCYSWCSRSPACVANVSSSHRMAAYISI